MSDHVTAQDGSKVFPWPPRIEPVTSQGKKLMQVLLKIRSLDDPLWELTSQFPPYVRMAGASLGWKVPFLFWPNPDRMADLWRRNKALMHLLVWEGPNTYRDWQRFAGEVVMLKDRGLLAALDRPASNALVRVLAKLQTDCMNPVALPLVIKLWQKEPWMRKMFCHLPCINHDVMQVLQLGREVAGWHLLFEAAGSPPGQGPIAYSLRLLQSLWRETGEKSWPYQNLRPDEMLAAIDRLQIAKTRDILYPPPPIPGASWIRPIRTPRELLDEGRKMRNCSFTFDQAIQEGRVYLYRVKSPKCICTALIKQMDVGIPQTGQIVKYWALGELRTYDNHPPSRQVLEEVIHWLRAAFPLCTPEMLDQRVQCGDEWCEVHGWPEDFGDNSPY